MSAPTLALIVPVRDDAAGLARLLAQVAEFGLFDEVIVVDDGSEVPVVLPDLSCPARLIRQHPALGGGAARNRGLAEARADYVLFFDADDLLCAELRDLWADLVAAGPFDLCLFKHADSRVGAEGLWGQSRFDEVLWARAGVAVGVLQEVPEPARPVLAQTANYPWNKIQSRALLDRHGIGCAETAVHQDIPLHWLALMAAGRVLASDRICAWHEVRPGGGRITNAAGAVRLQVFEALAPVARAARGAPWRTSVARFALGLGDWIRDGRLDAASRAPFEAAEARFVATEMAGWAEEIAPDAPELARELEARAARAGAEAPAP